ncbi:MAG: APC family permease [Turicibacter sp.]|nr:APC family permease [Turicibacter sp.]
MNENLTRRYGLFTAICLVVGTVIGSGIFFRNDRVFAAVGGNMFMGVAAWGIGGLVALSFAYAFGTLSAKYEDATGLSYFAEKLVGKKFSYIMGWYMATMFFPPITGVLAWVSGRFTVILLGFDVNPDFSAETYIFALFYLVIIFGMNELSPKLSEKFHISCTFIKVIPLIAMALIGTIIGLVNGTTMTNIQTEYIPAIDGNPFYVALIATLFAYLGWEVAMSLNKEIKDVKKNLPKAVVIGMLIVTTIYVGYFVGLFGAAPVDSLTSGAGVMAAFSNLFGSAAGTILFGFIIISCLGTLNGLVIGSGRMFYSLSTSNTGPRQEIFSQLDRATKMPANSMALSLMLIGAWMLVSAINHMGFWQLLGFAEDFRFHIQDLMPISFKVFMIPIFVGMMIKEKELSFFKRFISPGFSVLAAAFLIYAIIDTQGRGVLVFAVVFVVITIIGLLLEKSKDKNISEV